MKGKNISNIKSFGYEKSIDEHYALGIITLGYDGAADGTRHYLLAMISAVRGFEERPGGGYSTDKFKFHRLNLKKLKKLEEIILLFRFRKKSEANTPASGYKTIDF